LLVERILRVTMGDTSTFLLMIATQRIDDPCDSRQEICGVKAACHIAQWEISAAYRGL
jgi:hypothetical protein